MKKVFTVNGMNSATCAKQVEKYVKRLDGVEDASANVATGQIRVAFDETCVRENDIISAIADAGYLARLPVTGQAAKKKNKKRGAGFGHMIVVWIMALAIMYLSLGASLPLPMWALTEYLLPSGLVQMILLVPVMLLSHEIFAGGVRSLKHGAPNMFTLVALGAAASATYSIFELVRGAWMLSAGQAPEMHLYFDTSAMVLALVSLGKYVEARAKLRTSEALSRLSRLCPETMRVLRGSGECVVNAAEIAAGETVVVCKGEIIPTDGTVMTGEGCVDASMFAEKSEALCVREGMDVLGGSTLTDGEIFMKTTCPQSEMRLARMLSMVEEASASKAPIARTADRITAIFVPLVMAASVITGILWGVFGHDAAFAVKAAVCVLVISCPCALGLATPSAVMAGTGKGAELGILVKNAAAMQKLGEIDTVIFDKTGTLTAGEMRVCGCVFGQGGSRRSLMALAASAEQHDQGSIAAAIMREAADLDLPLDPVEDWEYVFGQGIRASVGGMRVLVGNRHMMELSAQDVSGWNDRADELADKGASVVYVAADGRVRGLIALRDELRVNATEAVKMMNEMGIHTMMLTGDDPRTADAIAAQAGVTEARCSLSEEDKNMMLRILQADGKKIMLVSDDVQDGDVMSRADLRVTVSDGTGSSIGTADVVIMRGDIRLAAAAAQLGRLCVKIIRENLLWAFVYNIIGIPLAAGVLYPLLGLQFSPMLAAAVMCLAGILVVFNALRLRRFSTKDGTKEAVYRLRYTGLKKNVPGAEEAAELRIDEE